MRAELTTKVAVGATHQQAFIEGSSTAAQAINPITAVTATNLTTPGGVFAQINNSGNFSQNQFTVVPEIGLNLKYAVRPWLHLQFGYSAVYWSNVARPGAQIDPVLNTKLVPTGASLATLNPPPGTVSRPRSSRGKNKDAPISSSMTLPSGPRASTSASNSAIKSAHKPEAQAKKPTNNLRLRFALQACEPLAERIGASPSSLQRFHAFIRSASSRADSP